MPWWCSTRRTATCSPCTPTRRSIRTRSPHRAWQRKQQVGATYIAAGPNGFVNGCPWLSTTRIRARVDIQGDHERRCIRPRSQLANRPFRTERRTHRQEPTCSYTTTSRDACGGTIQHDAPPSCDTGYASMGIELGAANLVNEAASFGFGARPPIDLPTNPFSVSVYDPDTSQRLACRHLPRGDQPFLAYSAIGQGNVEATPLEMAMVASGIADDGVIMKPHVMAEDPRSKGQRRPDIPADALVEGHLSSDRPSCLEPYAGRRSISPDGTAYGIFPPSWQVAAKTGTAQAGTGNTATTDWMIAFAPASHPRWPSPWSCPIQALSASGASVSGPIVSTCSPDSPESSGAT